VNVGDAPANEWLDALIRQILQSSFGDAGPPPVAWVRIRRHILRSQRRTRKGTTHHSAQFVQQDMGRCDVVNWKDVLVQRERYQDLLREAERHRLVRRALAGHQRRYHFYCRAMNWLGRRMVAWGQRLQEQHSTATAATALQAANYQP
jgi:hypothetical protein